jgi:REP element-mobilizing transposase RayT
MISATTAKSVSKIVGYFKQFVSRQIGFSPWQKSFHDHIIRNENDYRQIAEYIENNPQMWTEDCLYGDGRVSANNGRIISAPTEGVVNA